MVINITPFNYSLQIQTVMNLTNLTQGGLLVVVKHFTQPFGDYITLVVVLFTVAITYIKTESPAATAYVLLLLSSLMFAFVPNITLKIAYIMFIFAATAMLYYIYKRY